MIKKIVILLICALAVTSLWFIGLEILYARLMAFASSLVMAIGGSEAHIVVEQENGEGLFRVHTIMDGNKASYPQRIQTLLYPTIIILGWQIFTAFMRSWRQLLRSAGLNLGVFFSIQVIFLLLLSIYHTSGTGRFFYDLLMESFYVIAVAIIIIDNIRFPVFVPEQKEKNRPTTGSV